MTISKRLLAALFSFLLLISAAVAVTPASVKAQTVEELLAQIQSLMVEIQALKAQLAEQEGGQVPPEAFCHTFNANLRVGDSGADVEALQTALVKENVLGAAKVGFGEEVASAVSGFQEKYASGILTPVGLSHGTGYVGPSTRAKLNALYACAPTSVPAVTPPAPSVPQVCAPGGLFSSVTGEPCSATSTQPSITVISPNGGETYPAGSTISIQWLGGDTDNVSISVDDTSGYVATGPGGVGAIGFIATRASNSHTYSWHIPSSFPPGSYKVRISPVPLTNDNQVESDTSNSYFTITAPTTSTQPLSATCSANTSNYVIPGATWSVQVSGGTSPYKYQWSIYNDVSNYGEGSTQSSDLMVDYSTAGSKQAAVRVTDSTGASVSASCSTTIASTASTNQPPVINSVSGQTSLTTGQTGQWDVSASDPEGAALNFTAYWGDGTTSSVPNNSTGQASFSHSWSAAGTYGVTFAVSDIQNNVTKNVSVTVSAPTSTTTTSSKPLVCGSIGDVNGDGVISSADKDLVSNYIVGNATLTATQKTNADVSGDGAINSTDVSYINGYLTGSQTTFPACSVTSPTASLSSRQLEQTASALDAINTLLKAIRASL